MDSVQQIIKTRLFVRMWRMITGKVACCKCGHWERARNRQTRESGERTWYCAGCGELIRPARSGFLLELFVFLLALGVTFPLFIRLPDWIFENGTAPIWFALAFFSSWFFTSFLIAAYCRANFDDATSTKVAGPYGHCLQCGYDLNYAVSERCPECGTSAVHVLDAINKRRSRTPVAVHD